MSGLLPALISLVLSAPPAAPFDLPKLVDRGGATIQSQWEEVKELADDPTAQAVRLGELQLERARCTDALSVLDLLRAAPELPYAMRDTWRGRVVARPELLAVMALAGRLLSERAPGAVVTIGDIAQPGCGQIKFGTTVTFVDGEDKKALLARARWVGGAATTFDPEPPELFVDEWPRFADDLGPVWVEHRLTGLTVEGAVRVEIRRFDEGHRLGQGSIERLMDRTRKRLADRRAIVLRDVVKHTLDDGRVVKVRRGRWRDKVGKRFVEVIFRDGVRTDTLSAQTLLLVREARIDPKKPTSLIDEERYVFSDDGEAGVRVDRHVGHYEAHHVSHLAGFDADLSYITVDNAHPFEGGGWHLNPKQSFTWLSALDEAARRLAIPMKALFVDRRIVRAMKAAHVAPPSHPAWRAIHLAPGHDSHVHVRVGSAARFAVKSAAEVLELVGGVKGSLKK